MGSLIAIVVLVLIGVAAIALRRTKPRGPKIENPRLAFFNLLESSELLDEDRRALGPLFASKAVVSSPQPCDVLFLYCTIDDAGRVTESDRSLRDLIQATAATIVVIASPNPAENCFAAAKNPTHGFANLVMTLDRGGSKFPRFFANLFKRMKEKGESMPVAWNELAPQYPGADHSDVPGTIMLPERGQVRIA